MRTRVFAALIAAFVLPALQPASARPLHHHRTHVRIVRSEGIITCNMQGCHGPVRQASIRAEPHRGSSGGCPHYLGCGCNLAHLFGLPVDFHGLNLKWARDWAHVGSPAHKGCVGCVVVLSRGRGGHVGIVKGYDANGNPVAYSYANARLGWTTTSYSARRVLAYRQL